MNIVGGECLKMEDFCPCSGGDVRFSLERWYGGEGLLGCLSKGGGDVLILLIQRELLEPVDLTGGVGVDYGERWCGGEASYFALKIVGSTFG